MNGLRIIRAEIANFKNIDHKIIEMNGRSMVFMGKNGAGKSSLIQAIMSPMNAKLIPSEPIQEGEERSVVEIVIAGELGGQELRYKLDIYFTPANKKGRIVITDQDGNEVKGKKGAVADIVGNIGFDMFEFINLAKTKDGKVSKPGVIQQIEILKQFLSKEERGLLHQYQQTITQNETDRTAHNKIASTAEAFLKNSEYTQEQIDFYKEYKDPAEINKKLGAIGEEIAKFDGFTEKLKAKGVRKILALAEIEELKKEITQLDTDMDDGMKWIGENPRPDAATLNKQIEEINEHNKSHLQIKEYITKSQELTKANQDSQACSARMKDMKAKRQLIFAEAKLPVKKLSFDDDQIYYGGLPLTSEQIPHSSLIGIGVKIAMKMNPNLKVIVIHEGSLFDKETLRSVLKMAEKYGYQVLVEIVDPNGGPLDIQFTEDYLTQ